MHTHSCFFSVTVPFYDTLGPESVEFILKQTSTKTVVSTRAELGRLCTVKKSGLCPHFKAVVLVDGVTADAADMAKQAGLEVMSFAKVEAGTYRYFFLLRCVLSTRFNFFPLTYFEFPNSNKPGFPILYARTDFFRVS